MERIIFLLILCTAIEGEIGKHVFVADQKQWNDAQAYCRQHHTDLSVINNENDINKIRSAAGGQIQTGWIGLYRDNSDAWKWSGGGYMTYANWNTGEPNNYQNNEDKAILVTEGKWHDRGEKEYHPFYCINITVVEEKKPWEEALNYCRERNTSLPSLLSETDLLLAQSEIRKRGITDPVWIGLRFMGDHWLWMKRDPMVYVAWPQGGDQDHQCPVFKRCGAISKDKDRQWQNWDCQDNLNFICI